MKKLYKLCSILLVMALMLVSLTACGGNNGGNEGGNEGSTNVGNDGGTENNGDGKVETVNYTVSFETNGGSAVASVTVTEGTVAERPADPTKTDFHFGGWYTDAELTNVFDFVTPVTGDVKLYAAWIQADGSIAATFYTDEATVHTTVYFEDGGRIAKPADPAKEGYYFAGWFNAEGVKYKATTKFNGEQKFYAKWLTIYTFEAEDTQLTGLDPFEDDTCSDSGNKLGQSYSGNVSGGNLIGGCSCNASGDAYVTNLYYNGAFLEFIVYADEAVEEALLFLRLSAEFTTISLTKDTFLVMVNDTKINYEPITIVGGTTDDLTSTSRTPMTDYAMGGVALVAGKNVIRLEVNNSDKQFATGTMDAAAPMIDAIRIYTETGLTMEKFKNK